jgi:hypothetical protein
MAISTPRMNGMWLSGVLTSEWVRANELRS